MKKIKYFAYLLLAGTVGLASCVDADIDDALEYEDHYKTETDADNAVLGAYSSFMRLAGQMIVLNELRGDLLDITDNSSVDLQEINRAQPSTTNAYADPAPYYNVILNCNDAMTNFEKMYKNKRLTENQFLERYSDLMALRSYVYLQMGAQFGEVRYITEPIVNVSDISKDYPLMDLDALIPQLIADMTSTTVTGKPVSLEDYSESPLVQNTLDGYTMKYFFINKHFLMGDLYLWNDQFHEAACEYKILMDLNSDADATNNYFHMKVAGVDTWNNPSHYALYSQIFFLRYMEDDTKAYNNQWAELFYDPTDRRFGYEFAWSPAYDATFAPVYPFIELFAPTAMHPSGRYQLKPSDYAVDSLWGKQEMKNGFPLDGRGANPDGSPSSYGTSAEGNYVYKYLSQMINQATSSTPEPEGRLFLQRAALLHLRYCEAVNRAGTDGQTVPGHPYLAYSLLNQGIGYSCNTYTRTDGFLILGDTVANIDGVRGIAVEESVGEPYYFAASETSATTIYGYRREPWRSSRGVRGRVALTSKEASDLAAYPKTLAECESRADSIEVMEKIILDEAALECAFEGNRFPDLVRVARRMNKQQAGSGNAYMRAVMDGKYGAANPYTDESSWFLPLE